MQFDRVLVRLPVAASGAAFRRFVDIAEVDVGQSDNVLAAGDQFGRIRRALAAATDDRDTLERRTQASSSRIWGSGGFMRRIARPALKTPG